MSQNSKIKDEFFISIIILNYNGGNTILDCVESVFKTVECKFEVILIDNNSSDNSHLLCQEKFPEIILIQNDQNIGLSGRNFGINKAKGNFIVFLDSDTLVEPGWLSSFLKSYKEHGEGLYQPKLLDMKNPKIINSAGNMINLFGQAFSRGKGETDKGQYDDFQRISYTSGACTFTTFEVVKKIGQIDPLFFAYHDDVDYGWRGALQNIPSYYEPKISIYHKGSQTLQWSSKKFYFLERNRWICLLTLYSRKTLLKLLPILILVEFGTLIFFIKKHMTLMKLRSFFSIIKLSKKIEFKRKSIVKERKVSDVEVIKNFVDEFDVMSIMSDESSQKHVNSIINNLNKRARKVINM